MTNVKPCYVLDACALLAQAEPGMEAVRDYLYAAQRKELPLVIVPFVDELFWQTVKINAFAAALALERQATLLITDPEFEALGEQLPRIAA